MLDHAVASFAQAGEDRIVHMLFNNFAGGKQRLTYADLGAGPPIAHNNTFLAYTLGGRGLIAEADPKYAPQYAEHRPLDSYEQVAVVPARLAGPGVIAFEQNSDPGLSGIAGTGLAEHVAGTFTVPAATVNDLLARHFPSEIDLLSVDIEGLDTDVLGELDVVRFRPKVVIAENAHGVQVHREMMDWRGYQVGGYTLINTLYFWPPFFSL